MLIPDKISIVVPVYNSHACVEPLARRVAECLANRDYELILVNDASPDECWEEIKKACARDEHVVGINLRKNSGQDHALLVGCRQAAGAYVIVMDDDLQHDPADIPRLIQKLAEGYDVCYANFESKNQKWWKDWGSWFNGKVAEVVVGKPRGIYMSAYKAVRREVVEELTRYEGPYPYLDGLILMTTHHVCQIPAEHHARFAGKSNYGLVRSAGVWAKLVTGQSLLPLRGAMLLGFATSALGFMLMAYFLADYFTTGKSPEGWLSLMTVTLLLGGVILLSLGVIGEYVGRSYILSSRKPTFGYKEIIKH